MIIAGYYFLQIDEVEIYKNSLKKVEFHSIKTYDGKSFTAENIKFYKKDGEVYLIVGDKIIPILQISLIDNTDINAKAIKEMSKNAITGIILTACGGLLLILSVALKDYV